MTKKLIFGDPESIEKRKEYESAELGRLFQNWWNEEGEEDNDHASVFRQITCPDCKGKADQVLDVIRKNSEEINVLFSCDHRCSCELCQGYHSFNVLFKELDSGGYEKL